MDNDGGKDALGIGPMETANQLRHWRTDLLFIATCLISSAIAYPFEPPWRAIIFSIAIASIMLTLVIGLFVARHRRRSDIVLPEIDKAAICFHGYMAFTIAVAQFFEPPITGIVIIVFCTALLIAIVIRSKLIKKHTAMPGPSTNELQR